MLPECTDGQAQLPRLLMLLYSAAKALPAVSAQSAWVPPMELCARLLPTQLR